MDTLSITHWHWLILGVALLGGELLLPGVYLLWIGVAALVTGVLVALLADIGLLAQGLIFAGLVIASAIIGRRVYGRPEAASADTSLNRRASAYVGRVITLQEAIANGRGRVSIDGTPWVVTGPDLAAGSAVRVIGSDGTVLKVEPASG